MAKELTRVRIKSDHRNRQTLRTPRINRRGDYLLVATMNAIKITDSRNKRQPA